MEDDYLMLEIKRANKDVERSQVKVVDLYLKRFKEAYRSADQVHKERIVSTRDGVSTTFDSKAARRVRREQGLTQEELAKELGTLRSNIARYETGGSFMIFNTEGQETYLNWLADNGYKR